MKVLYNCLTYYYTLKCLLLQWFNDFETLKGNSKSDRIFTVKFMILKARINKKTEDIFKDFTDTLVWSCLDGTMGEIYTNAEETSASAIIGDFCFLAGIPCAELAEYVRRDYTVMVPQNEKWSEMIKSVWGDKARKITRYATKKENTFDLSALKTAALPEGYEIKPIDRTLFDYCKENVWCRDFVSQYENYEQFESLGLGFIITKDGVPVSGASSYSVYKGGIEIQVDTLPGFRRIGLAYCACAKLILVCIERGIFPSWDAHNLTSLMLAEKLGYQFSHSYTAYEIFTRPF